MVDPHIQALLESPIGAPDLQKDGRSYCETPEAISAARRASKIWLPEGKRSANSKEEREKRQAIREQQIDLEEAIVAAGGQKGSLGKSQ